MLNIRARTSNFPNSLYDSGLKKRRIVGLILIGIMLALFLAFNRVPKLDTVQADLAVATSPAAECFQGFCIEGPPEKSFFTRWWEFSLTYLQLVTVGMIFAFLVAGATEAFVFPKSADWRLTGTGIRGSLKGLLVGPAMNLCSACIVPVASAFRRRGSGIETTLSITQGSSTFNLPSLIMAAMVFAPLIGGSRIAVSLVGVLLIGPLVAKVVNRHDRLSFSLPYAPAAPDMAGWRETIEESFKEWAKITAGHVMRLAPVMVLAGFASGFAIQWLSPQTVTTWLGDDILGVVIAATIGIAINVPLLFEIPLVAVLLMAGMGTAPAAALLFTAAAAGPITFWGLSKVMPRSAIAAFAGSTWLLGIGGGLAALLFVSLGNGPDFGLRADYGTSTRFTPPVSVVASGNGTDWASSMRFTDVTLDSGITHTHTAPEPLLGKTEPTDMVGGAVAEDFDGDGWLDLFVLRGGEAPSVLYMNEGDGTFSEEAALRGADLPTRHGVAAAAADYDNDGDSDIVVSAQQAPHYLLVNDGSGKFSVDDTTLTEPKMFATSPSWGDVDNDGDLELALGEWNPETAKNYDAATKADNDIPAIANENPLIGSDDLSPLFVYANDGQGRLEPYEFRAAPGIDLWVFAPRFADLDDDGLTDLAVVSDYGMSRIYRNVGNGMFQLERSASPTFTDENGMGAAIGDYDNDGDLDWFVSSIFGQNNPDKGVLGGTGNRFYRNESEMRFADLSSEAGVRDGGWGWAASFGDLDNDGDLDLYHVNGWVQQAEEGNPDEFNNQPARLFENGGYFGFHEVAEQTGSADKGQGRGVILFDYDNDGDLDIFITNNHEYTSDSGEVVRSPAAPTLLRNDTPTSSHWLKVTLDGSPPLHSHGIGSRVYVTVNGLTQMRELNASTNFVTQGPGRIAHFGLGSADTVDEIRVEWVNGETSVLTNVPADQHISIPSQ
ncbi:MAG: hypothetical protein F4Y49_08530 [Dehalococcoidia bacterium]|nr:hypothetical protein [Dehalococcoidia bacterium]